MIETPVAANNAHHRGLSMFIVPKRVGEAGEDSWREMWKRGRDLTVEELVAFALEI